MHDMLKKKKYIYIYIYAKKNKKAKRIKIAFKYGCKRASRKCKSYSMYLKGDSLHQPVMIVCKLN